MLLPGMLHHYVLAIVRCWTPLLLPSLLHKAFSLSTRLPLLVELREDLAVFDY